MKKIIALLMVIGFISLAAIPASATTSYESEATELKSMGLFQGTGKGFELDLQPTRAQSAVMLVRFLGKEELALAQNNVHPFKDVPAWANKYIGYLYANNLTNGVSADLFGSNNSIDSKSYATYLLRSLGYDDTQGDFTWKEAINKSIEVGILAKEEADASLTELFLRGNMVHYSYSALSVKQKDQNQTLKERLIAENVITPSDDSYIENTEYVSAKGGTKDFYIQGFGIGFEGDRIGTFQTQVDFTKSHYEIYFSKGYDMISTPEQHAWMYMDMGFTKPLQPGKFSVTFHSPSGKVIKTVDFKSSADNNYFAYSFDMKTLRELINTNQYNYVYFKKTVYSVDGEELEFGGRLAIADENHPIMNINNYYNENDEL